MQQHQAQAAEEATSAAEVRVTPQELMPAIAAMEAGHDFQHDTLSLGEAIDVLALDMTPEALLAEVRAQRQTNGGSVTFRRRRARWQRPLFGVVLAVSLLANAALILRLRHQEPVVVKTFGLPTLADVAENTPAYVSVGALQELANGARPETIPVSFQPDTKTTADCRRWALLKRDSALFVRVYGEHKGETIYPARTESGQRVWTVPLDLFERLYTIGFSAQIEFAEDKTKPPRVTDYTEYAALTSTQR